MDSDASYVTRQVLSASRAHNVEAAASRALYFQQKADFIEKLPSIPRKPLYQDIAHLLPSPVLYLGARQLHLDNTQSRSDYSLMTASLDGRVGKLYDSSLHPAYFLSGNQADPLYRRHAGIGICNEEWKRYR